MPASALSNRPPFKDLRFGFADAEQEGVTEPNLLLKGYMDLHGVAKGLLHGHHFLVLGYKGSGKSAVSQHLRLRSETNPELFVKVAYLSDFPYADFQRMVPGPSDSDARMPAGWLWVLVCSVLDSFAGDEGAASITPEFSAAVSRLREEGLLPSKGLPHIVRDSVTRTLRITLPKILEYSRERKTVGAQDAMVPSLIDSLVDIACSFESDSEHVVLLDGLDDVFIGSAVQYKALAALLLAISRLNRAFEQRGTPAKVVLLCRTDLFERLPGPNKNKLRQDAAIHLDWYYHTREPSASNLVQLANLKARVHHPKCPDVINGYFPVKVKGRPIYKYLLDYTRHTPRDFLQLLRRLQEFWHGEQAFLPAQILSGIRWYSTDYFLPEIRDELVGYLSGDEVDALLTLLSTMKSRHFRVSDVEALCSSDGRFKSLNLENALSVLFECSAIGTVDRQSSDTPFFTFKYRNRHSSLKFDEIIRIHQALWTPLNLTREHSDGASDASSVHGG